MNNSLNTSNEIIRKEADEILIKKNLLNILKQFGLPHVSGSYIQCWHDREYRRSYNSMDIYNAVVENNITTIEPFKEYLKSINSN